MPTFSLYLLVIIDLGIKDSTLNPLFANVRFSFDKTRSPELVRGPPFWTLLAAFSVERLNNCTSLTNPMLVFIWGKVDAALPSVFFIFRWFKCENDVWCFRFVFCVDKYDDVRSAPSSGQCFATVALSSLPSFLFLTISETFKADSPDLVELFSVRIPIFGVWSWSKKKKKKLLLNWNAATES